MSDLFVREKMCSTWLCDVWGEHTMSFSLICYRHPRATSMSVCRNLTDRSPYIGNLGFSCCFKDIACDKCRVASSKGFKSQTGKGLDLSSGIHLVYREKKKVRESMHWYWWRRIEMPPIHTPREAGCKWSGCPASASTVKRPSVTDYWAGHCLRH